MMNEDAKIVYTSPYSIRRQDGDENSGEETKLRLMVSDSAVSDEILEINEHIDECHSDIDEKHEKRYGQKINLKSHRNKITKRKSPLHKKIRKRSIIDDNSRGIDTLSVITSDLTFDDDLKSASDNSHFSSKQDRASNSESISEVVHSTSCSHPEVVHSTCCSHPESSDSHSTQSQTLLEEVFDKNYQVTDQGQ